MLRFSFDNGTYFYARKIPPTRSAKPKPTCQSTTQTQERTGMYHRINLLLQSWPFEKSLGLIVEASSTKTKHQVNQKLEVFLIQKMHVYDSLQSLVEENILFCSCQAHSHEETKCWHRIKANDINISLICCGTKHSIYGEDGLSKCYEWRATDCWPTHLFLIVGVMGVFMFAWCRATIDGRIREKQQVCAV